MLRLVKQTVLLLGVLIACQSAFGFALDGPIPVNLQPDDYEVGTIGYNLAGDITTPKDIREEYRRNTPVMYYAYDQSFWEYFGTNGVNAIDQAMAMFNSVGKVSALDINSYPEDSRRVNFRAQADNLLDLKSFVMGLMCEQLGFLEPTRWVWALHGRQVITPPPCPGDVVYSVYQRNFSTVPVGVDTYPTTSYVNGVLYSYFIIEFCGPPNPVADAVEFPVDPLSSPFSAVADYISFWYEGLPIGGFYTSLTRDDVAAMKYLIATNNLNNEGSGLRTAEFVTNSQPAVIQTLDLGLFAAQARTNSAAALIALYPGLVVTASTPSFGLAVTTNITAALLSSPFDPAGFPPSHLLFATNYTTNFVTFFDHTFGNIVTNSFATRGVIGSVTLSLTSAPFSPAGFNIVTNGLLIAQPVAAGGVFGDFFILPTNACSAQILSNLLTTVTITTNLPTQLGGTTATATNIAVAFTPGSLTFATNHLLVYLPVTCPLDSVAIRGGVDRLQFVRRDYDSLISQSWDPVTNDYTLPELDVTNAVVNLRHFQRRVPRPDFVFSVADLAAGTHIYSNTVDNTTETITTTVAGTGEFAVFRSINFNQNGRPSNLAGPGTIEGPAALPTLIILQKLAPLFANTTATAPFLIPNETTQIRQFSFGSFDGTTNAPIVYPNGTSLEELENQITGPASATPTLPDANIGALYSAQLAAVGGVPPYTWSLAPGSPGLPGGLNISSDGQITGIPSGPAAIYDFTLRISDSLGAFRDIQYTISVF